MASSPTIELNGKLYDARTGKMLPAHQTVSQGDKSYVKPITKKPGAALDGFAKRKTSSATAHSVHKKTQRSQTLMRSAVKKPTAPAKTAQPKVVHHTTKQLDINPRRASHAKTIKKSQLVSKFGAPRRAVPAVSATLPVRSEPAAPPLPIMPDHHTAKIAPTPNHQKQLEEAIHRSTSHANAKVRKPSRRQRLSRKLNVSTRTINVAAASLAVMLLGGFVAYQNVPNLSMKLASTRAGVEGRLPSYKPSGFDLAGPIKYQQGQITLSYSSNSDERAFKINQRASQWNSDSLLESYVAPEQKTYQTFQDSGKTIYIYDENNATWVDGGVWYQIEGNAALNSDQLLRMAASL